MKNIEYITAGAGSGKTFTLTEKLLNEIRGGLKTDQVILTTFTKAAAEEFKIKAADKFKQKGMHSEAQQLSGAMIGTIDSLSQFFVQKYWYLLGMSPELNVMGDSELEFYQVNSLIDSKLITPSALSLFSKVRNAFDIVKKENFVSVEYYDFWKDDLLKIISLSRNYGISSLAKSQSESFALIDSMFNKRANSPIDWSYVHSASSPANTYKKLKTQPVSPDKSKSFSLKSTDNDLSALIEGADLTKSVKYYSDGSDVYDDKCALIWNSRTDDKAVGYGNSKFLDKKCFDYTVYCNECIQSTVWGDLLKEYVQTICSIALKWQNQYAEYKKDHHLVDFNDIELKFKELLSYPQVVDDIRNQYRLVMVDEFQDCNPLQVEIFDKLSEIVASNGGKSVWVGDEKQSIYGFRGSDMRFIQSVIAKFPPLNSGQDANGLHQSTLKYSFRSRKKLVEKANDMVNKMFGSGDLDVIRKVGSVDDLDDALGQKVPAVYNWHSDSTNKDQYYKDVAMQVKALINGDGPQNIVTEFKINKSNSGLPVYDSSTRKVKNSVSAGDIAILARKTSDVNAIVEALNAVGVKVNAVEGDIMDMGEIQLLMAILNYAIKKNDYSRAQILYLWDNKKVEDIIADRITKTDWKSVRIISDIDYFLVGTKGFSVFQLVEALLLRLDIWNHVAKWGNVSRRHANINTFLRIVKGYEEHTRLLDLACSVMGFVNYINSDRVSADTPFVKDPEAVSVITYHKSKGLEWPVVILCNLENDPLDEQTLINREFFGVHNYATNPSAITCSARDEYLTIFPPVSGNYDLPEVLKSPIASRVQYGGDIYEKIKAEEARLLYVGFTRARDYVITLDHSPNTRGNTYTPYALLDVYDIRGTLVDETNAGDVISYTVIPTSTTQLSGGATYDEITESPRNAALGTSNRYISPSKLGHGNASVKAQAPVVIAGSIAISVGKVPMNEVGTCIHDIYAVFDDSVSIEDMVTKAEQVCDMHNRSDVKPNSKDFVDAVAKLYDYIRETYGNYSAAYHELPVMHKMPNNQIMNGEIDLLWCLSDKEAIIIDFKSMKDDDQVVSDSDLISKGDGYAPQLCAYKSAVEKNGISVKAMILFFPLQGKIVELK